MANAWSLKQFTSPYSNHIFLIGTSDTHISNAEMFEGRRLNLIYGIGGNNTCGVADILKAFSHLRAALEGTDLPWHWLTSRKYTIFISAHISFFYANKTAVCEWRPSLVSYSSTWRGSKHTHCITIWCSFDRFEHGSTPGFDFAACMLVRVAFFFFIGNLVQIFPCSSPRWPLTAPMGLVGTSRKRDTAAFGGLVCMFAKVTLVELFSSLGSVCLRPSWFQRRERGCYRPIELWQVDWLQ